MADGEKRKKPNVKEIVRGQFLKVWMSIAIAVIVADSVSTYALYEHDHVAPTLRTDQFGEL
jgi:hypothetical protein